MKKLSILLLYAFLFVQSLHGNAQASKTAAAYDSLQHLLTYFHKNTIDTGLKQAIDEAQALLTKDAVTDSLAKELITVEDLMSKLIYDSVFLNRHPFDQSLSLAFGNALVSLLQPVLPQKESLWYAAALNNLGVLYEQTWGNTKADIAQAYTLFGGALLIRKKLLGEKHPDYAESLGCFATVYGLKDEKEKAKSIMLQSLAIRKKAIGEEDITYADNLFTLAQLYAGLKQYDTATLLFERGVNIRKKISGENNADYALHVYIAAERLLDLWQYQKAFAYYKNALSITENTAGKENIQYAYCLEGLAGFYYVTGEYEKAVPLYLQSLAIKEKLYGKGYYDIALTMHNLGTTYFKMGNYEQAIPCFQRIAALNKKTPAIPQYSAYELNWQGLLYQSVGNYDKALSLYSQALNIPEYAGSKQRYANTLSNIAALYENLNDTKRALFYLEEARQITEKTSGQQSPDYATILYNLSTLYKKLNRYNTALQLCDETLTIRKRLYGEAHPQYALSLYLLGSIYMEIKKADAANTCFAKALEIQKQLLGEEHPDYINTLNKLAELQISEKKNNEAASAFIMANRSELKHISRTYTSLSEQEKAELENNEYYQFSYLPSLMYKHDMDEPGILQQVYSNELALKGMVLNDQQNVLNSIRTSNDTNALELYNKWRLNKIILSKQLLLPAGQRLPGLDSIEEATNDLEQDLSRVSVPFRQQQKMVTTSDISVKLLPDEAAIEFIKFRYYNKKFTDSTLYAAMIILPHNSVPEFIPLFEEKQLINLLNRQGKNENSINNFYSGSSSNSGNSLYKLIWKPLERYLTGIHTVYYAPTGLLHRIAFQALPVDSPGQLLIDRYNLSQVLSTRTITSPSKIAYKPSGINIWADIQYDSGKTNLNIPTYLVAQRGMDESADLNASDFYDRDTTTLQVKKWTALNGTKLEMDSIKNIFANVGINAATVTGVDATEEVFKTMDEKSPQVLHIATHGFFWPLKEKLNNSFTIQQDPMFRSGLVLAGGNDIWKTEKIITDKEDGILTSYEIAQLDLSNTDLVVLSACETALGDLQGNEGMIGLQRAFKIAGVKQLIISLWSVPDKQTAALMTLFYRNWINGQSTRSALRSAQLKMKEEYSPYYWAGFVLVE
jgi:CHAT domain-containing protein/tetratricopeptide (TPR) repeat protein